MRRFIPDESVDLCYIDPPFSSNRDFNQIYNNPSRKDIAQAKAFVDTWTWDNSAECSLHEIQINEGQRYTLKLFDFINGLERILERGPLFAYLISMAMRVNEIYRVLKPTGTFYLHCDPTASHYLKILLDTVFGVNNFRNEITWKRSNPKSHISRNFPTCTDIILRYTKSNNYFYKQPYAEHDIEYVDSAYRYSDNNGRYRLLPLLNPNDNRPNLTYEFLGVMRVWRWEKSRMEKAYADGLVVQLKPGAVPQYKKYLHDSSGKTVTNCWVDIKPVSGNEALGYPTQKPEALLHRIISASSIEDDVVLDAYCGCGTTVAVAHRLNRRWIGIDITYQSISLIIKRLEDTYGKEIINSLELSGVPKDFESARSLALKPDDKTRKEFEKWSVLTYSNNRAMINEKKGSDKGIDATIFIMGPKEEPQRVIFSVKSGKVQVSHVRDLRGTVEREKAAGGILITLSSPTSPMIQEAKSAGFIDNSLFSAPLEKIKIVTVEEILSGARLQLPLAFDVVKSAKLDVKKSKQREIFDENEE